MSEAWIALFAALFGGAGLKAVESLIGRSEKQIDLQTQFREELRGEIEALRKELRLVDDNLRYWRERYYEVVSTLTLAKGYLSQSDMKNVLPSLEARNGSNPSNRKD